MKKAALACNDFFATLRQPVIIKKASICKRRIRAIRTTGLEKERGKCNSIKEPEERAEILVYLSTAELNSASLDSTAVL